MYLCSSLFTCDFNLISYLLETAQLENCFVSPPNIRQRFKHVCNKNAATDLNWIRKDPRCSFQRVLQQKTPVEGIDVRRGGGEILNLIKARRRSAGSHCSPGCAVSQHALGVEVFDSMESVQLPCRVNVSISMESTVVWSREDLRFSTVHIHQQSGDDLSEQNQRYSNRTMMSKDALRTGDLSLTLKNPTVSDSETYTCTVRRFGRELSRIHVHLQVKEHPHPTWLIPLAVVLILFFVLAAVFGLVIYRRYKRIKRDPVYKLQVVKTAEGVEAVVLPCKTKVRLPPTATVEWRRVDTDQVVHLYPSIQLHCPETVRGLTQMEDNPLRTGDLSLTLYSPNHCDSGLYVCTVQKGGNNLKQKVVSLFVEEHLIWSDTNSDQTDHMPERNSLRQSLKSSLGGRFYYDQSSPSLAYDRGASLPNGAHMAESTPEASRRLPIFHQLIRSSVRSASELSFSSLPPM